MAGLQKDFWRGFASGYAPDREDLPPRPSGLQPARYKGHTGAGDNIGAPDSMALWLPRAFLKGGAPGEVRGPLPRIARLNRRNPGLRQTLILIEYVNPGLAAGDREMKLLALACVQSRIALGELSSAAVHDLACEIIDDLGIDLNPDGWAARTSATLPQAGTEGEVFASDNIVGLGQQVGRYVAFNQRNFVPAKVEFENTREKHRPSWSEVTKALASVTEPTRTPGRMSWKMMTPGRMNSLVWEMSFVELGQKFGVSDTAIRAFCRQRKVDMPSPGFWRMSEERRNAVRIAVSKSPS